MYQPELGRFLQPDPKQFEAGDYNLYRYCHNDPINKTDPLGLDPGPGRDFLVAFDNTATGGIATGIMNAFDPSFGANVDTGSNAYSYGSKAGFAPGGVRLAAKNIISKTFNAVRKLMPDSKAKGPHTTFKRDQDGKITNHGTFDAKGNPIQRTDVTGKPHYNKETKQYVPTPHTHTPTTPGGVRPALPGELPKP